ncbi:hypothetical protein [Spirochaeta thermophila]|uniref:Uncharacterized protein n=1 Tax=Winmispira thermophila (strain ATCC 49972 / DSM 6192 / RI 19.B1) TaxID=665571 RepID=E0RS93_WINT6|nr:hypothetical protein [Spirochaeta thermophila]ADN01880.1 hypothetical protein STHERM_c09330 [Spirochaeta thermophila DSM 6192]
MKITYALAGGGSVAALSLLIGLFSGNPLGVAMLRALGSGVLFGGVLYVVWEVVRRFLPELVQEEESAPSSLPEKSEEEQDHVVDIVLEDEASPSPRTVPGEQMGIGREDDLEESVRSFGEGGGERESQGDGEGMPDSSPLGPDREDAGLDEFPEIDDLEEDFFEEVSAEEEGPEEDGTDPLSFESSQSISGGGGGMGDQDPQVIAQAIRTLLKKDEKG